MDIGDSPRETDLPILKHTFDTFIKTINVSFFRKNSII